VQRLEELVATWLGADLEHWPVLPPDLAGTVAHAGVDPTLEGRALQDALRAAIAVRGGYCWWDVDSAGWVVTLSSPQRQSSTAGRSRKPSPGVWCG
jgi:hypothetical protein